MSLTFPPPGHPAAEAGRVLAGLAPHERDMLPPLRHAEARGRKLLAARNVRHTIRLARLLDGDIVAIRIDWSGVHTLWTFGTGR